MTRYACEVCGHRQAKRVLAKSGQYVWLCKLCRTISVGVLVDDPETEQTGTVTNG